MLSVKKCVYQIIFQLTMLYMLELWCRLKAKDKPYDISNPKYMLRSHLIFCINWLCKIKNSKNWQRVVLKKIFILLISFSGVTVQCVCIFLHEIFCFYSFAILHIDGERLTRNTYVCKYCFLQGKMHFCR